MSEAFDPYRKWLGIPPAEQPPHHYRLLGVGLFEDDADTIDEAADRQMAHVQTHKTGPHGPLSQKLLNELAAARLCLLDAQRKAAYDDQLRRSLQAAAPRQPLAPTQPLPLVARPLPMLPIAAGPLPLVARPLPMLPIAAGPLPMMWSQPWATAPLPFHEVMPATESAGFPLSDTGKVVATRNARRRYRRRTSSGWPACGVLMLLAAIFIGVLIWNKDAIRARSRVRNKPTQSRASAAAPKPDPSPRSPRPLKAHAQRKTDRPRAR